MQQRGDADGEEAGRLEAGVAVTGPNVQWRFQRKLLATATQKAPIAATRWCTPRSPASDSEDGEVDQVAGAADDAELEQLHQLAGRRAAAPSGRRIQ